MSQPLLEGHFVEPEEEVSKLKQRIRKLEMDLQTAIESRHEAVRQLDAWRKPVNNLRNALSPLYKSLRHLFGEMEEIPDDAPVASVSVSSPRASAIWDSWKQKLGGKQAEFIQALLEHGHPMTSEQLRVTTHTGRSTVPQIIYKLNSLGLINKHDGKYSLKTL